MIVLSCCDFLTNQGHSATPGYPLANNVRWLAAAACHKLLENRWKRALGAQFHALDRM
jgi:hypothetical protein